MEPIAWYNGLGQTGWQPVTETGVGIVYYKYPWGPDDKDIPIYRFKWVARWKGYRYRIKKKKNRWKRV